MKFVSDYGHGRNKWLMLLVTFMVVLVSPATVWSASATEGLHALDLTSSITGILAVIIFVLAYALVMSEEFIHLRKSKPVIIAAGMIWSLIALAYRAHPELVALPEQAVRHNLLEYAELMLFLLVAMAYINSMDERNVFEALRSRLVSTGFGYRGLFWVTGILSFFISPIADNLTTALLMCAVVMAVGGDNKNFVSLGCINIVVAANAGGAFSPFGDITTLMVWQKGIVDFWTFFNLFIPSVVNFLIPAAFMHFAISNEKPDALNETVKMKEGAKSIVFLFLMTIATAVSFHNFFHLPPVIGMLTGLGYLQLFGFFLKRRHHRRMNVIRKRRKTDQTDNMSEHGGIVAFDVFHPIARAEWDTLLFFYGVVACVGGLGFIGYLGMASELMYTQWGATSANIAVGVLSAIVDNIPVMFAVITMNPEMSTGQWLLVTLTAGVGGSLLTIGSAAGIALMGQARGVYTFFGHLKWTPVIALGYAASIYAHFLINSQFFR